MIRKIKEGRGCQHGSVSTISKGLNVVGYNGGEGNWTGSKGCHDEL